MGDDVPRSWMVRAGSIEREEVALAEARAIVDWRELPDIGHCATRSELRELVAAAYPDQASPAVVGNWTGQLWRLLRLMEPGDIVVMPLKRDPDCIAIGTVSGDYVYADEKLPGYRHSRPVQWVSPAVPRSAIHSDLLNSLGSLRTICELARHDAEPRLRELMGSGIDPGWADDGNGSPPADLSELVRSAPTRITIRGLLDMWGYRRRTARIVEEITAELDEIGLLAVPSIMDGYIDRTIDILLTPGSERELNEGDRRDPNGSTIGGMLAEVEAANEDADAVIRGSIRYVIGTMDTAETDVLCVRLEDSLALVVTKMALADYSQVAVVDGQQRLVGVVTWESIALAHTSGAPTVVRDALTVAVPSALPHDELLIQADVIYRYGFVFVVDAARRVQGVVTSADLTRRFADDHRPVVLLDEIERRLAHRVSARCARDVMAQYGVKVPSYGATLGTYVKCLEHDDLWARMGWAGLDRAEFHATMDRVREIRNQLMHFSPDPLTSEEVRLLEHTARLLRLVTADADESSSI